MQFIKCMVNRPGLLDNRVLDFSDRLTIVFGRNGSGKSLIARGLVDALWRGMSDRMFLADDAWKELSLDLRFSLSDSGYYRVLSGGYVGYEIRYIGNNEDKPVYSKPTGNATLAEDAVKGFANNIESRTLREFLKRIDCSSFVQSSFIPSAADITGDAMADYDGIRKIILDDASDFYGSYVNLRKVLERGRELPQASPPEVVVREDKIRELDKKIQIMNISDTRHEKLNREKNTIRMEIEELNSSLHSLNSQKEILNKIIENLVKVNNLKTEFEKIKDEIQHEKLKIESISHMKNEIDTMFPQFSEFDIADGKNLDRLQEVFNDIRNLNERIDTFYSRKEDKKRRFMMITAAVSAGAVSSSLFILIKNSFMFEKNMYLWVGIVAAAAVIIAGNSIYTAFRSDAGELEQLEDQKKRFKERIKTLMEKSKVELEDYKLTEIYELLLQYFEDYINYTERKKDLVKMKNSLKAEEYMIEIQSKLDALKQEEEEIKDEITISIDTLNIVDDIENETSKIEELIQNIDREVAIIREKVETKERIVQKIEDEFVQSSSNGNSTGALMEEKKAHDRILKKWKINQNSLHFIMQVLTGAVERREEKQLKRLLDSTLDKFNHLTGNQYITTIDEEVLLQIITGGGVPGDLNPQLLHALLISIKFSLSDFIISGTASIPLLIDEPFQFMDDERCNRFRDLVSYISNMRQVIIFTHQSDKRNWGNFIEL